MNALDLKEDQIYYFRPPGTNVFHTIKYIETIIGTYIRHVFEFKNDKNRTIGLTEELLIHVFTAASVSVEAEYIDNIDDL